MTDTKTVARNEDVPQYNSGTLLKAEEDLIIARALAILEKRFRTTGDVLNSPNSVKDYLKLTLGNLEHEVFSVVYLNTQHAVIETEQLFRGTLTQTSVYPREVLKRALAVNAAAVIFAHNHPSGVANPSSTDKLLTEHLAKALSLVDIRVLDHFVIAGSNEPYSFAEKGLL